MTHRILFLSLVLGWLLPVAAAPGFSPANLVQEPRRPDVAYIPTPQEVVDEMLRLAEVSAGDVLYDLGSGDGRVVIAAAARHGARGVGIEISPRLVALARANAEKAGVSHLVTFLEQDLFEADLREATVVTLYLLPELNVRLRPRLLRDLRPGTMVVSHDFDMGDWGHDWMRAVQGPSRIHNLYAWAVPAHARGVWTWQGRLGGRQAAFRLTLDQLFQRISGTLAIDGAEFPVIEARLLGDQISFATPARPQLPALRFSGRIQRQLIDGTMHEEDRDSVRWTATRSGD